MMQEGQSRQKHPKCACQKISKGARILSVKVFNHFSSLHFWRKAICLRKDRWEARRRVKSALAARVSWRRDWDGHLRQQISIADADFPVALLSVMSRLLPTTSVIKTNKKRIWETFPSETDMCVPGESSSRWIAVFWFQGWERRRCRGDNSWTVLFLNYKAFSWCFVFQ